MASYKLRIKRSAQKEIRRLPSQIRKAVVARIGRLIKDPRPNGVEKLREFENVYRVRVGKYRIVYGIDDRVVTITVIKVGHRKDVYRR